MIELICICFLLVTIISLLVVPGIIALIVFLSAHFSYMLRKEIDESV